jgi:hypothetical protein
MVEELSIDNMIADMLNLQGEECILVDVPADSMREVQLQILKRMSYNNLFQSYMNNTSEEADRFKFDDFLKKYTEVCTAEYDKVQEFLMKMLGSEIYSILRDTRYGLKSVVNPDISKIVICRNDSQVAQTMDFILKGSVCPLKMRERKNGGE